MRRSINLRVNTMTVTLTCSTTAVVACAGYLLHPSAFQGYKQNFSPIFTSPQTFSIHWDTLNDFVWWNALFTMSSMMRLHNLMIDRRYSPLFVIVLTQKIWVSSDRSYANNCDAVPQGLPSRWCIRLLALIWSNHIDRGSAVQFLHGVAPDWSTPCIPWPPVPNVRLHGLVYDPCILAADCPWTFHKPHSLGAFDMASSTPWCLS